MLNTQSAVVYNGNAVYYVKADSLQLFITRMQWITWRLTRS